MKIYNCVSEGIYLIILKSQNVVFVFMWFSVSNT